MNFIIIHVINHLLPMLPLLPYNLQTACDIQNVL